MTHPSLRTLSDDKQLITILVIFLTSILILPYLWIYKTSTPPSPPTTSPTKKKDTHTFLDLSSQKKVVKNLGGYEKLKVVKVKVGGGEEKRVYDVPYYLGKGKGEFGDGVYY